MRAFLIFLMLCTSAHAGTVSVDHAKLFTLNQVPYATPAYKPVTLINIDYNIEGLGTKSFPLPDGTKPLPLTISDGLVTFTTMADGQLGISFGGKQLQNFNDFSVNNGNQMAAHWIVTQALTISTDHKALLAYGRPVGASTFQSNFPLLVTFSVPEPSTLLLGLVAVLGFLYFKR